MDWGATSVLVTGGCSFIGSHLVDALAERAPRALRIVDDLSSGDPAHVAAHLDAGRAELVEGDLLDRAVARDAVRGIDVVFHLAAIHGGRGFIDLHESECAANLALDGHVLRASLDAGVRKLVFASSACVYPVGLQADVGETVRLEEPMVGPPFHPDGIYGWAKLSTERTLLAMHREHGLASASCRLFTVYGERCRESHAIIAMIARAVARRTPFEIWGDGSQIRNWTYVGDIVDGLLLAAERIDDGRAVNLGTEEPISVMRAARAVLELTGHDAPISTLPDMPTGPLNRVASHALATRLMGWRPRTTFEDGLRRTVAWYAGAHEPEAVAARVASMLTER